MKKLTIFLLSFFAVIMIPLTISANQEIPNGWHESNDEEYAVLELYLNNSNEVYEFEVESLTTIHTSFPILGLNDFDYITEDYDTSTFYSLESRKIVFQATWNNFYNWFDVNIYAYKNNDLNREYNLFWPLSEEFPIFFRFLLDPEADPIPEPDPEIDELPITNSDRLGTVAFTVDGYNLEVRISYNNRIYYLNKTFTQETDMEIFDTIEAYYMNINNKPQIIINHSDRPYLRDILENPDEKPAFVPHTVWDLNSNELLTISDYKTYVYIKQNEAGVMIAYVYIDEYIIDNMISANLQWTQRQNNPWPYSWIWGKYSEWETRQEIFTNDDYLRYRNLTSDWQNYVPFWNFARGIYQLTTYYEMPRIDNINWFNIQSEYNVTKFELENHFNKVNSDFTNIKSDPRYKVWAFALQGGKSFQGIQTEIYHNYDNKYDPMNFKIIQLIYETNGKLYEAVGDDMDLVISIHDKIDGLGNEQADQNWIIIAIFVLISVFYLYVLSKNRGFKDIKSFIVTTVLFVGVIVGLLLIYNNFIKG